MKQSFALVIEDDPSLGAIFVKTLERAGFETALDIDGNLYSVIISSQKPSVVILDFHLPFTTGDRVIADLWTRYPDAGILIIVVTADLFMAKTLQAQGELVLTKPVSPMRLTEIIAKHLETKQV